MSTINLPAATANNNRSIVESDVCGSDVRFLLRYSAFRTLKIVCSGIASIQALFYPAKQGLISPPENKLLHLSVSELVQKIKTGAIRSEDVVHAYIERIKTVNPLINAVVDERFTEALAEARAIDMELQSISSSDNNSLHASNLMLKPLLGVPFTCKDSIGVKGMVQSSGSLHRKNVKAMDDADSVCALRQAGAIPLAITNVPEILLWWDSRNLLYGITKNPHDLSRIAGGSSGGEAALLAASGSPFGLGSDMGGSIRIPCAFNGVFGHKTSPGIVPTGGMFPEITSGLIPFVSFGPMTQRATDLPLLLSSMVDKETIKKLKLDEDVEMQSLNMIWMENEGGNPLFSEVSDEVLERLHGAVEHMQSEYKITSQKVHFPRMLHTLDLWSACLAKADGRSVDDLLQQTSGTAINPFLEIAKSFLGLSSFSFNILFMTAVQKFLGSKKGTRKYLSLNKIAEELKKEVIDKLGPNGFLLCPTMPEEAPKHSSTVLKGSDVSLCGIFNVLGLPSTHVPLGLNRNSMPIGIQVVSCPDNDRICLAVAIALEKKFGGFVHP